MAKSVQKVKSSLKLRTQASEGVLSLKIGRKNFTLPFEVRMLSSSEFVFVHIPPCSEIMKIGEEGFEVISDTPTAELAAKSFRRSRKRNSSKSASKVELPAEVSAALNKIPPGYKIAYGTDGSVKLVRTRKRRKKA